MTAAAIPQAEMPNGDQPNRTPLALPASAINTFDALALKCNIRHRLAARADGGRRRATDRQRPALRASKGSI